MAFPAAKQLPEALLVLWTIFLAAAIWSHIPLSPQLPIYDTLLYYWKAYAFWSAVHSGHWFNPLNLAPAFRPPGTVLMSYPFGFEQDPRGFYFRSIFVPAALMILAAYTVARRRSATASYRWLAVLIAVLFSTPSLFYYFAIAPRDPFVSYWGLVDGFLSGVAALAAAAAWRCVREKSIAWACIAAATSSLCVLIKPSGTMVAALIGVLWAALALTRILIETGASPQQRRADIKRYLICGAIIAGVDALILAASLSSAYLSDANLAYGTTALKLLKTGRSTLSAASLWPQMRAGPGFAFMLVTVLAILVPASALLSTNRVATLEANARFSIAAAMAAFVALGFGLWFWLFGAGTESQVRFAMPFFAISMVWMVPAVTEYWRAAPRPLTACATVVMLAIPLNLALLLAHGDPSAAWQRLSGISLDLGVPFAPTSDFQRFVEEPRTAPVIIYAFDTDAADQTMDSLALQQWIFQPQLPTIRMRRPLDWQRPTTFRIEEMVASDFLLFQPALSPAPAALAGTSPRSFQDEVAIFRSWASQLGREEGVEVVIDSPSAKLLRVVDRTRLQRSLLRMIATHRWGTIFTEANRPLL